MHSSHFRIPAVTAAVLLASGISGAASAANVELYGSIDNGLRVTAARGIDGASSQTTVGMESGQWFPNLIGLKGSESLGNGYSVAFSLENRFNSDSGTFLEEGRLFDNQALLMVNTEKWTVAAGRMEGLSSTMGEFDLMCPMEPFEGGWAEAGGGNVFANIGLSANNAVAARVRPIAGLTVTGAYSFGVETEKPGFSAKRHYAAIGSSYQNDRLWAGFTYEVLTKGDAASKNDHVFKAGVNYDFGPVRAFIAYSYTKNHTWWGVNSDSNSYMLGFTAPAAGGLIRTSVQYFDGKSVKLADGTDFNADRTVASIGYTYPVSKRTTLWGVYSYSHGSKSLNRNSKSGYTMASTEERAEANRSLVSLGVTHFF